MSCAQYQYISLMQHISPPLQYQTRPTTPKREREYIIITKYERQNHRDVNQS